MLYRGLADFVFIIHLCFVIFAIFGGLLALRWRWLAWLHLPALIWAVAVEFFQLFCPLTTLENYFIRQSGEQGYAGGFIEYYVSAVLYLNVTALTQMILGAILLIFNVVVYCFYFKRNQMIRAEL